MNSNDKDLIKSVLTQRLPFMTTKDQMVVYDHLPITRVLANGHPMMLGISDNDKLHV